MAVVNGPDGYCRPIFFPPLVFTIFSQNKKNKSTKCVLDHENINTLYYFYWEYCHYCFSWK
jgi:hypothetical protein